MMDNTVAPIAAALLCLLICGGIGYLLGRIAAWLPVVLAAALGALLLTWIETANGWDEVGAVIVSLILGLPAAAGLLIGAAVARRRRRVEGAGEDGG